MQQHGVTSTRALGYQSVPGAREWQDNVKAVPRSSHF